jgi:hypothetical protein
MKKVLKIKYIIAIFLLTAMLSSCSILRGRKCNCPQWSKEIPVSPSETIEIDAAQA